MLKLDKLAEFIKCSLLDSAFDILDLLYISGDLNCYFELIDSVVLRLNISFVALKELLSKLASRLSTFPQSLNQTKI